MPRATGENASAKAAQLKPRKRQGQAREPAVTEQQMAYVNHYLTHFNKAEAACAAGYSNAKNNVYQIHYSRGVQHEFRMRAAAEFDYQPATQAYVSSTLREIVQRCVACDVVRDAFGKPIMKPVLIHGEEVEMAVVYAFDPRNAISALSKLGESIGMFGAASRRSEEDGDAAARDEIRARVQEIEKAKMQSATVRTLPEQSDVLIVDVLGPRRYADGD